ncbi:hypothetical protein VTH8203_02641 [Vibrio thalassae]|uniref:Uncharacterized protein n=1 Tax=Vibrio thalassae TaxID=1243014 RepID=A0A240EK28_9VIBR|nr:hypothetical protein VTH8203_02641 [Vibrio thalassae]
MKLRLGMLISLESLFGLKALNNISTILIC